MAETSTPSTFVPSQLKFERSPLYRTIYADIVRPRIGNGDITAIFGKGHHEPGFMIDATIVTEEVEVVMSWMQLKMVNMIMGAIIDALEEEIGKIVIPSNFQADPNTYRPIIRGLLGMTQQS